MIPILRSIAAWAAASAPTRRHAAVIQAAEERTLREMGGREQEFRLIGVDLASGPDVTAVHTIGSVDGVLPAPLPEKPRIVLIYGLWRCARPSLMHWWGKHRDVAPPSSLSVGWGFSPAEAYNEFKQQEGPHT